MSKTVDTRTAEMRFDNRNFESNVKQSMSTLDKLKQKLKLDGASKGLEEVERSSRKLDFKDTNESVGKLGKSFSALETIATGVFLRIGMAAADAGMKIIKSLSVDQVTTGWNKYAEKTTAVQTIMANIKDDTGKFVDEASKMDYVNRYLEKLMWFSDETSYNFTDMTGNVGKFIANGQNLEESVTAMQGIATWAAISGQNAQTASRAMYNISQAMGVGAMTVKDWMSIENANMATAQFKELAITIAEKQGKIKKGQVTVQNFRESLSGKGTKAWFDKKVMMEVFQTYGEAADRIQKYAKVHNVTTTEAIREIKKQDAEFANSIGFKAFAAAQEAKTFEEVISATADAASTKWQQFFENIFGDYLQAKELWTNLSEDLYDIFVEPLNGLNEIMSIWNRGFFDKDVKSPLETAFESGTLEDVGSQINYVTKEAAEMAVATDSGTYAIRELEDGTKELITRIKGASGEYKYFVKKIFEADETLLSGRDMLISGFKNLLDTFFHDTEDEDGNEILSVLGAIKKAFMEIFFPGTETTLGRNLWELTKKFKEFTERIKPTQETIEKIKNSFKGLFTLFKIAGKFVKAVITPFKELFQKIFGIGSGKLLDFTDSMGTWIQKFDDFLEKSGAFEAVSNFIRGGIDKIKEGLDWLTKTFAGMSFPEFLLDTKNKIVTFFKTYDFKGKFEKIGNFFKKIIEPIRQIKTGDLPEKLTPLQNFWIGITNIFRGLINFFKFISVPFRKITGVIADLFGKLADSVSGEKEENKVKESSPFWDGIKAFFKGIGDFFKTMGPTFKKIGEVIGELLSKTGSAINKFLENRDIGQIIDWLLKTVLKIIIVIKYIRSIQIATSIAGMFESISDVFYGISKMLKGGSPIKRLSKLILTFAASLYLVAKAFEKFAAIKFDNAPVWVIGIIFAAFGAMVTAMAILASKLLKNKTAIRGVNLMIEMMLSVVGSLIILTKAFEMFAAIKFDNAPVWAIGIIFAAFGGMVVAMSFLATKFLKNKTAIRAIILMSAMMVSAAISFVILAKAFAIIGESGISSEQLLTTGIIFAAFGGMVVALAFLAKLFIKNGKAIAGIAVMAGFMITAAYALKIVGAAFSLMAKEITPEKMWSVIGIIIAFTVMVGALAGIGAALASTGMGLAGMALVALIITAIGLACLGAGAGMALMVNSITNLLEAMSNLMEMVNTYGAAFIDTIGVVFNKILDIIIATGPKMKDAIVVILTTIAQAIVQAAPTISYALVVLLIYVMQNVSEVLNKSTDMLAMTLMTFIVNLIYSLANNIRLYAPELVDAVRQIVESIIEVIVLSLASMVEVIPGIGKGIAQKMASWIPSIRKAFETVDEEGDSVIKNVSENNKKLIAEGKMAGNALTDLTGQFTGLFSGLGGLLGGGEGGGILGGITSFFGSLTSNTKKGMHSVTEAVKNESPEMQKELEQAYDSKILDNISSKYDYVSRKAAEAAVAYNPDKYVIRTLDDGTEQFVTRIKNANGEYEYFTKTIYDSEEPVTSTWGAITSALTGSTDELVASNETSGSDYVTNFLTGMKSKFPDLEEGANAFARILEKRNGFSEPEEGPLSNFHTFAPDMIKLWCKGVYDNLNLVDDSSKTMSDRIKDGFGTALDYVSGLINDGMSDELTIRPIMDLSEIQNGMSLLNSMVSDKDEYSLSGTVGSVASAAYGMKTTGSQSFGSTSNQNTENNTFNNTFNISNNDPNAVAEKVSRILSNQIVRKQAVWGNIK